MLQNDVTTVYYVHSGIFKVVTLFLDHFNFILLFQHEPANRHHDFFLMMNPQKVKKNSVYQFCTRKNPICKGY